MQVHITQYLCQNRHCIIAMAWEDNSYSRAEIELEMTASLKQMKVNPWCGLCGSTNLRFEDGLMAFGSLAEANDSLRVFAADQALTRALYSRIPKPN